MPIAGHRWRPKKPQTNKTKQTKITWNPMIKSHKKKNEIDTCCILALQYSLVFPKEGCG